MSKQEKFLALTGLVKCESGQRMLDRGDPVPEDILPEELERLRALGVFGTPKATEPDSADAADVLAGDALADWVANEANADQVIAEANTPEKASELLEYEQNGKDRKTVVKALEDIIAQATEPDSE